MPYPYYRNPVACADETTSEMGLPESVTDVPICEVMDDGEDAVDDIDDWHLGANCATTRRYNVYAEIVWSCYHFTVTNIGHLNFR